jgi:GNAT superfamily N-acetyltransferase
MATLTGEGGPLNDLDGDSMQDALDIDELIVEEPQRRKGIGTRFIQELPYLCKRLLHLEPDILAYYVAQIRSTQSGSA